MIVLVSTTPRLRRGRAVRLSVVALALTVALAACSRSAPPSPTQTGSPSSTTGGSVAPTTPTTSPQPSISAVGSTDECTFGHRGILLDLGDPATRARVTATERGGRIDAVERDGASWARIFARGISIPFVATADDLANSTGDGATPAIEARVRGGSARSIAVFLNGKAVGAWPLAKGEAHIASLKLGGDADIASPPGGRSWLACARGAARRAPGASAAGRRDERADSPLPWSREGRSERARRGGGDRSMLRIGGAKPDEPYSAPTRADAIASVSLGGTPMRAVSLRAPGYARCTGWLPADGRLVASVGVAGAGDANLELRVVRNRAAPVVLSSLHVTGDAPWKAVDLPNRRTRGGRWCGGKRDARCDRARRSPFDARCSHPVRRPSRNRVGHCSAGRPGAGPPCARERRCPGGRWGCRSEADRRVLPRRYGAPRARRAGQERHRVRGESRFWRRLFGRDGVDAHRARASIERRDRRRVGTRARRDDARRHHAAGRDSRWDVHVGADDRRGIRLLARLGHVRRARARSGGGAGSGRRSVRRRRAVARRARDPGGALPRGRSRARRTPPWDATPEEMRTMAPVDFTGGSIRGARASCSCARDRRAGRAGRPCTSTYADRTRAWALYALALKEHDAALGRLLAALKAAGRDGDTLVIVTSDVGLGEARAPLGSRLAQRAALATPLVVRFPAPPAGGDNPGAGYLAGRRVGAPTTSADVGRTIVDAFGLAPPRRSKERTSRGSRSPPSPGRRSTLGGARSSLWRGRVSRSVGARSSCAGRRQSRSATTFRTRTSPKLCDVSLEPRVHERRTRRLPPRPGGAASASSPSRLGPHTPRFRSSRPRPFRRREALGPLKCATNGSVLHARRLKQSCAA